ncbi:chorismate mutase [Phaeovibrio sulfidiphilus]|uniref:chorismate mutase n=1 Tax=Phaeovibrio sulfidiphilus TaxID=1220600 RepID=A0A8J7CPX1_9PROT|nr:chorismate mutase [Phaeovibrio sulfidiphilus]MBE1237562.1 chorismate mutase [Phaeovibrio sulfidiphilus]
MSQAHDTTRETVSLGALRSEIDSIDDALHDLLMRRAELAEFVRLAKRDEDGKDATYLRPGREAAVLRRLMARHSGRFPRRVLVRLWREIFSVSLAMQNRMTLAVWMPERGAAFLEIAHNQYGSFTTASLHQSMEQVIREVSERRATLGILPLPETGDRLAWWPLLATAAPDTPRVIARLPMAGTQGTPEALVIAIMPPEADDCTDRTLLALEHDPALHPDRVLEHVTRAGVPVRGILDARTDPAGCARILLEVDGAFHNTDARLEALETVSASSGPYAVRRVCLIGSYARPFTDAELDPDGLP